MLQEMTGQVLHWRVLLKHIKTQVGGVGGFVLERDVIKHFVPDGLQRSQNQLERAKVEKALQGLHDAGYCVPSIGQTDNGVGRVITLLKYPNTKVEEDENDTGNN